MLPGLSSRTMMAPAADRDSAFGCKVNLFIWKIEIKSQKK
jgi:hypothetical protein